MNINRVGNNRFLIANTGTAYTLRLVDVGNKSFVGGVADFTITMAELGFDPRNSFMISARGLFLGNERFFEYFRILNGGVKYSIEMTLDSATGTLGFTLQSSAGVVCPSTVDFTHVTIAAMSPY